MSSIPQPRTLGDAILEAISAASDSNQEEDQPIVQTEDRPLHFSYVAHSDAGIVNNLFPDLNWGYNAAAHDLSHLDPHSDQQQSQILPTPQCLLQMSLEFGQEHASLSALAQSHNTQDYLQSDDQIEQPLQLFSGPLATPLSHHSVPMASMTPPFTLPFFPQENQQWLFHRPNGYLPNDFEAAYNQHAFQPTPTAVYEAHFELPLETDFSNYRSPTINRLSSPDDCSSPLSATESSSDQGYFESFDADAYAISIAFSGSSLSGFSSSASSSPALPTETFASHSHHSSLCDTLSGVFGDLGVSNPFGSPASTMTSPNEVTSSKGKSRYRRSQQLTARSSSPVQTPSISSFMCTTPTQPSPLKQQFSSFESDADQSNNDNEDDQDTDEGNGRNQKPKKKQRKRTRRDPEDKSKAPKLVLPCDYPECTVTCASHPSLVRHRESHKWRGSPQKRTGMHSATNPSQDGRHVFITISPLPDQTLTTNSRLANNTRPAADPRRLATQLEANAFRPTGFGMLLDPMLTDSPSDFADQQDRLEGLCAAYVPLDHLPLNSNPFWQDLARENPSWGLGTTQANHQLQPIVPIAVVSHHLLGLNIGSQDSSIASCRKTASSSQEANLSEDDSSQSQNRTASAGFAEMDATTTMATTASSPSVPAQSTPLIRDDHAILEAVRASFLKEPYISPLSKTTQSFASLSANSQEGMPARPFNRSIKRRSSHAAKQDCLTDQEDESDEGDSENDEEPSSRANTARSFLSQGGRKRTRITGQGHHSIQGGGWDYQSMMYNMATMSMVDLHQESAYMSSSLISTPGSDSATSSDPSTLINLPLRTQLRPSPFKSRYTRSNAPPPSSRSGSSPPSDLPIEPSHYFAGGSSGQSTSSRESSSPTFSPPGIKKRRSRDTRYLQFKGIVTDKGGRLTFECNACPRGHFQFHDDRQLKRHAVSHLFSKSRNKFRCLDCPDGQNFARRDAVRRHFESVTYKCCFDRGFYEELDSDRDEYVRRRIEPHWTKSSR
ncbi:hypothetical protein EMPS_08877 [Entomortierella parvispora]|uniref:C2H2-type domain-containing protein n=1 Tax=Entomortierella parvispora TaxID=205924 RepID=A0A9P3HHH5_9FUNG|nr:hypothetical protein EMPS_08877 [Entomortierella parvispora]